MRVLPLIFGNSLTLLDPHPQTIIEYKTMVKDLIYDIRTL